MSAEEHSSQLLQLTFSPVFISYVFQQEIIATNYILNGQIYQKSDK